MNNLIESGNFSCTNFLNNYNKARDLVRLRDLHDRNLQSNGNNQHAWYAEPKIADVLTTTAKLSADQNASSLSTFESNSVCLQHFNHRLCSPAQYRSINGYGNNLKNPLWGTAGLPFARFGDKTYDDGVHSIRKSVSGSELPNPRKIVQNVLLKAEKVSPPEKVPNMLTILLVLYLTHDLAHQIPVAPAEANQEIRCCAKGDKHVLSPAVSHSACLPISIPKDDPFYGPANIKCLSLVRAELATSPTRVQFGEILNGATSYIDHSIVYGTDESEVSSIRSYSNGKLNLGSKNVLPTDASGNYAAHASRLTGFPSGSIWPSLFSRNHNQIADGLSTLNPHWSDETTFQEARRINIASLQSMIFRTQILQRIFRERINETYNENFNPTTTLDFSTGAYRVGHFFLQPDMMLFDRNNQTQSIPISDTIGRIDIVEDFYDDVIRGMMTQPLNYNQYSDEV